MNHAKISNRTNSRRIAAIAVAAVAVVGTLTPSTDAQLRVDNSRASDANPRVGDGGFNGRIGNPFDNRLGNDLIIGNVTGGREFRGFIGYGDARGFRDGTSSLVANFTRSSSGATTGGVLTANSTRVGRFYGENLAVAAPPQFVRQPGVAGYVPQSIGVVRPTSDRRVGIVDTLDTRPNIDELPNATGVDPALYRAFAESDALESRPGENGLEGGLVPDGSAPLGLTQPNELLSDFTFLRDRSLQGLDDDTLRGIAEDLYPTGNRQSQDPTDPADDTRPLGQPNNDPIQGNEPLDSNAPLDGGSFESNQPLGSNQPLDGRGGLAGDTQFAEMNARLDAFNAQRLGTSGDVEEDEPTAPVVPGGDVEPAQPGEGPDVPDNLLNEPLRVRDLGAGVQGKPIAQLFETADAAMQEQRFADAIEAYRAVERVDPTNAMATFGRATAEMAGGYYGRAANTYRAVFLRQPALLMAQYDMPAIVGADRLDAVMTDLKKIINEDERAAAPALLMAIIHHNRGEARLAAGFLDMTQRRGGDDVLVDTLRQAWSLPATDVEK
ncbi:MAG: hypothetical protein AAF743_09290 [Planctomycetota bacterium]